MSALLQDLRYTARSLPRSVGFTVAAILTLAFGIGANTAMFSIVNSVLLRPLPYANPDRLVSVWTNGGPQTRGVFADIRTRSGVYEQVAAYNQSSAFTLLSRTAPERIDGASASPNLFTTLGVAPALGRNFSAAEDQAGNDHVVILSRELWQTHFGSDPGIIGRMVTLDAIPRTVVGVMPADFHFPTRSTQAWIPLVMDRSNLGGFWGSGGFWVIGRMRPGVTVAQAQADLRTITPQIRHDNPVWDPGAMYGVGAVVVPLQAQVAGDVRPTLLILLAAVGVVLLIACANIANLLLARGAVQSKAFAIRTALGARRRRLIQQQLTESVVLAAVGATAGFALALTIVAPLARGLLTGTPQVADLKIDLPVLTFTAIIAVLTGLVTGLYPALRSSDPNLRSLLNDAGRSNSQGPGQRRMSDALVTLEIALAVMLVIGAGLLIRSFWELRRIDPGFNPDGVASARIDLPKKLYATDSLKRTFYTSVLQSVAALPGVKSVGATTEVPLSGPSSMAFRVQGQIEDIHHGLPTAGGYHVITPDYLRTMGIPLVRGRAFTDADRAGAPDVVIINTALARRYWPHGNAIGQRIGYPWPSDWLTVVGVVGPVAENSIGNADTVMAIYRPFLQAPAATMTIVVKSDVALGAVAAGVRHAVAATDRTVPVSDIRTMGDVVSAVESRPRFTMVLLSAFAGLALLLGAVGIYGVVSYGVIQRTTEIGIRMALGAKRNEVLLLVVKRGAVLATVGGAAGVILSLVAMRALASMLYGVQVADPATFVIAPLLLIGVALLASYIPARRAASVDPVIALRSE